MDKAYKESLQMIKVLNIKNEKEFKVLFNIIIRKFKRKIKNKKIQKNNKTSKRSLKGFFFCILSRY